MMMYDLCNIKFRFIPSVLAGLWDFQIIDMNEDLVCKNDYFSSVYVFTYLGNRVYSCNYPDLYKDDNGWEIYLRGTDIGDYDKIVHCEITEDETMYVAKIIKLWDAHCVSNGKYTQSKYSPNDSNSRFVP